MNPRRQNVPSADAVSFAQISEGNGYYTMLDYIMKAISLTSCSSTNNTQISCDFLVNLVNLVKGQKQF